MESLPKTSDAPAESQPEHREIPWLDLSQPRGWSQAQKKESMERWDAVGFPTARGLQLFKSHPEFVIPWILISVPEI